MNGMNEQSYVSALRQVERSKPLWERVQDELVRLKHSTDSMVLMAWEMEDYAALFDTALERAMEKIKEEVKTRVQGSIGESGTERVRFAFRFSSPEKAERFLEKVGKYGKAYIDQNRPYTVVIEAPFMSEETQEHLTKLAREIEGGGSEEYKGMAEATATRTPPREARKEVKEYERVYGNGNPIEVHHIVFEDGTEVRLRTDDFPKAYNWLRNKLVKEGHRELGGSYSYTEKETGAQSSPQGKGDTPEYGRIRVAVLRRAIKTPYNEWPKDLPVVILRPGPTTQAVPLEKYLLGIDTVERADLNYDLIEAPEELFEDLGYMTEEEARNLLY